MERTRIMRVLDRIPAIVAAGIAGTLVSGCSLLVGITQRTLEAVPIEGSFESIVAKAGPLQQCLAVPGGRCKGSKPDGTSDGVFSSPYLAADANYRRFAFDGSRASAAVMALTSPTATRFDEIVKVAAGARNDPVYFSRDDFRQFSQWVFEASTANDWGRVVNMLEIQKVEVSQLRTEAGRTTAARIQREIERAQLLEAYVSAYFNNGNVFAVNLDVRNLPKDQNALKTLIAERFGISDSWAGRIAAKLWPKVPACASQSTCALLEVDEAAGFVTRSGARYAFPAIDITVSSQSSKVVSAAKVDFPQVGADLVRVYLEAMGDFWSRLPAVESATGVKVEGAAFLKVFKPDEDLNSLQFSKVNEWASRAEAGAASVGGQVLRGASWVALNNEAIAKLIETGIGVVARKVSEKIMWCAYACQVIPTSKVGTPTVDTATVKFTVGR